MSQILAKLEARDRVQAVVIAYEAGVVRQPMAEKPERQYRSGRMRPSGSCIAQWWISASTAPPVLVGSVSDYLSRAMHRLGGPQPVQRRVQARYLRGGLPSSGRGRR